MRLYSIRRVIRLVCVCIFGEQTFGTRAEIDARDRHSAVDSRRNTIPRWGGGNNQSTLSLL